MNNRYPLVFCLASLLSAQPAFDVASIKPGNPQSYQLRATISHGELQGENVTLQMLIEEAYQVKPFQIENGPRWLDSDHFEIIAKGDPGHAGAGPADAASVACRTLWPASPPRVERTSRCTPSR